MIFASSRIPSYLLRTSPLRYQTLSNLTRFRTMASNQGFKQVSTRLLRYRILIILINLHVGTSQVSLGICSTFAVLTYTTHSRLLV
jgi:hypothetical protein